MYKVVIVDDEPIIVEGLEKTVSWADFHCEVIGKAYSGTEGLELIRQKHPDMVFSDIRMADLDGLGMIAAIKSEYPDTEVTILTGYRDFEYAQTAIKLGVRRFLLKPSKMDEINAAIQAMSEALDAKKKKTDPEAVKEEEKDTELAGNFIVKSAVAYMEDHYAEKLQLADVADKVYVSSWHLSKLINGEMHQNFSEVLNGIRIKQAKELMKDPSLRIGDIADLVGFLDMAHFSRVFKKTTGMSANEYRNTIKL